MIILIPIHVWRSTLQNYENTKHLLQGRRKIICISLVGFSCNNIIFWKTVFKGTNKDVSISRISAMSVYLMITIEHLFYIYQSKYFILIGYKESITVTGIDEWAFLIEDVTFLGMMRTFFFSNFKNTVMNYVK